jgi:asparagine synthase (glutamine-hydrolysing)
MLTDLVLAEEWERFADELGMLSKFLGNYDGSRKALVGQYAVPSVKYLIKQGSPLRAWRTAKILHAQYGVSLKSLLGTIAPGSLKRAVRHWHLTQGRLGLVQLAKGARSATQYQRALPIASDAWSPSAAEDHIRGIELPLMAETFDYFDRIGARIGIEHRHPFFDKRLVEFCLALPLEHKVREGWTRVIMRESTKGILPEPIRLRSDKSNLGPNLAVSLVHDAEKLTVAFSSPPPGLSRYWDMQQLRETLERYRNRPNGMDAYALLLAYSHAMWLEAKELMPKFH